MTDFSPLPEPFPSAVSSIQSRLQGSLQSPKWGIICGSGLSGIVDELEDPVTISYSEIPGMAKPTVEGHKSSFVFGYASRSALEKEEEGEGEQEEKKEKENARRIPVVAALGRFHMYEGHSPKDCIFPIRLMKCLGVSAVAITNASGGLHPDWDVGTIVSMQDHLSLPTLGSTNPLVGANFPPGPRFPPTSDAYDPYLRLILFQAGQRLDLFQSLQSGTYAYVMGPSYESRAECKFLRSAGADCVGMSTVPEVIAARQAGLRVLGLSLITNKVVVKDYFDVKTLIEQNGTAMATKLTKEMLEKDSKEAANHQEVLEASNKRAKAIQSLIWQVICRAEV